MFTIYEAPYLDNKIIKNKKLDRK